MYTGNGTIYEDKESDLQEMMKGVSSMAETD
jgi:hypothetical protein